MQSCKKITNHLFGFFISTSSLFLSLLKEMLYCSIITKYNHTANRHYIVAQLAKSLG